MSCEILFNEFIITFNNIFKENHKFYSIIVLKII